MKKRNIIILCVVGVLIIGAGLFFIFRKSSKITYRLETTTLFTTDVNTLVTATGTVEPITKVDVGTQVSGIISKIYVDYNSQVKKDQVIAELEKTTLQSDLKSKQMELKAAETEYEYQKVNFNRINSLYTKDLVSKADYETSKYTYEKSEAAFNRISSDLVKVKTNLSYATIYSPIDGVVLSKAVEEGQTVAATFNTPTLFTIANDLTKMQVTANVDEADIGQVKEGQRVTFTVDAYPEDIFEGYITQVRLEATVTANVVTYEVIINAPNPDLKLKPGLTATINIYVKEKGDVGVLPNKSFVYKPDEKLLKKIKYKVEEIPAKEKYPVSAERMVWIAEGNTISTRKVIVGITDGINTEIVSGLNEKDQVVTDLITIMKNKSAK